MFFLAPASSLLAFNFWGCGHSSSQNIRFNYSKDHQAKKNEGGIPEGKYYIKLEEQRSITSPFSHIIKHHGWGYYSWSIHKMEATDTKGRSGFFIHGGDNPGSAGCIDVTSGDIKLEEYLQKLKQGIVYIYVKYNQRFVEVNEEDFVLIP
jgi:Tlde1 domain